MITDHERLDALLAGACDRFADRPALTGGGRTLTYAALADEAARSRAALAAAGHRAAGPVVVRVGNDPADLAAQLAVWQARGVVVPVHRSSPDAVLRETAERTGARLVLDGTRPAGDLVRTTGAASAPAPRELDARQALVAFTSGTTGRPKGVVLSHRALAGKLRAIQQVLPFRPDDQALQVLQLNFTFGQWTSLLTLATGGTLHLLPRFHAPAVLARLATGRTDRIAVVPSMLRLVDRELSTPDSGPRLRDALRASGGPGTWITGGEPLPAGLGRRLRAALPGSGIADVYGLSETSTSDFVLPPDRYDTAAGTIGRPGPGVEFRIAAGDGPPLPAVPGTTGELCLRTPYLMTGYLDDPAATGAAVDGGWLRTGDLAVVRPADGMVELVGRRRQLISRGGVKIAPLEVERPYADHPGTAGCLAVGVPDPMLGERVHLVCVPAPGADPTEEELRAHGRLHLEPYHVPERVHFVSELPLGRTGKTDRAAAARLAADATDRTEAAG
ncbi:MULTISPECIES: fatty acid--CoA ligase family protein [unclassified Streptomyces]|uniref:class I adenylate-forming enzyme family protein n=1 Tax=unclassified Streptomyces TaxID=2593676 RepID=UPI003428BD9B